MKGTNRRRTIWIGLAALAVVLVLALAWSPIRKALPGWFGSSEGLMVFCGNDHKKAVEAVAREYQKT
jgi:phosphoenolpyruvate carboxylase